MIRHLKFFTTLSFQKRTFLKRVSCFLKRKVFFKRKILILESYKECLVVLDNIMTSVYPSYHLSLKKYTENKCVFAFVNDTRCSIFTGKVLQHLFGICTEALYCGKAPSARCIWRPGALPNECELFYGFSRFAIELNEILETERYFLPKTDTRFRPDQRALEVSWARGIRKFAIQLFQCLILILES